MTDPQIVSTTIEHVTKKVRCQMSDEHLCQLSASQPCDCCLAKSCFCALAGMEKQALMCLLKQDDDLHGEFEMSS